MNRPQVESATGPPSGAAGRQGGTFAKVYRDLVTSGLLAELSGSQIKVLLALAVKAHVLGDARAPDGERHFQRLQELGIVTDADRGRLFCHLDRNTLARQTGQTPGTITRATNALAERHLLEKRLVRSRKGRHDYCVYFVCSSSCLAKFDSGQRSAPHREVNSHSVTTGEQKPAPVHVPHVQKSSSGRNGRKIPDLAGAVKDGAAQGQNDEGAETALPKDEPTQEVVGAAQDAPLAQAAAPSKASPPIPGTVEPDAKPRPPPAGGEWEAAMAPVYETMEQAGWPVTGGLRTALRAKAVRFDEAARKQGASGPEWVGEAMLVSLGRKGTPPTSTDEVLLAYADGVLKNWMRDGRSGRRAAATHRHRTARPPPASGQETGCQAREHEGRDSPPPHREPRSEEEMLWEYVLADLQLCMTRAAFDRWLRGSRLVALRRGEAEVLLEVEVETPLAADWLENRQKRVVQRAVEGRVGVEAAIRFQAREAVGPGVGE